MENLKELRSLRAEQVEQAEKAVAQGKPEEAQNALEEIKKLDERITAVEAEIKELTEKESNNKQDNKQAEEAPKEEEKRSMNQYKPSVKKEEKSQEYRDFMQYLRTKGQVRGNGVKSVDADAIIPKDIVTQPVTLPETVVDLKQFANVVQVKSAQGSYPVLESATEVMHSVEELEKNPELAKPKFKEIDYKVLTYRGAVAVSQESLDDSDADLAKIVADNNARQALNTTNKAIAEVMKTFTPKTIKDLDGIKEIINVDLDPAYNLTLVATQSMYQALDTLKDKNGRFLLKQDITAPSGQALFGRPVAIVRDELLGKKGEAKAFVGDVKHAIFFADRVQSSVRWIDNDIYGSVLAIATRFDVKKAVEEAGVFVTYKAPAQSKPQE